MKKIKLITLAIFFSVQTFAQSGEIKGKIIDKESGQAMPGASVYVDKNGNLQGTVTDIDGYYTLKPLEAGRYDIKISFVV